MNNAPTKPKRARNGVGCDAMVLSWLASNKPPKPGAIHLHCRTCGRFKKNMPRAGDPSAAALLITQCDKCNRGDFTLEDYVDMRGQDVGYGQPRENNEICRGSAANSNHHE